MTTREDPNQLRGGAERQIWREMHGSHRISNMDRFSTSPSATPRTNALEQRHTVPPSLVAHSPSPTRILLKLGTPARFRWRYALMQAFRPKLALSISSQGSSFCTWMRGMQKLTSRTRWRESGWTHHFLKAFLLWIWMEHVMVCMHRLLDWEAVTESNRDEDPRNYLRDGVKCGEGYVSCRQTGPDCADLASRYSLVSFPERIIVENEDFPVSWLSICNCMFPSRQSQTPVVAL
ncbi:uncharacterized protein BDR25DRAFT_390152 [Lindgomyces ingoldianus]|uniref:Uncharacterized protein n=1 Tax=Lindgomyces ingoldianus TaxID=673940 RepID=A0ACB6RFW1_9PLEO|nr:uncharacterized protein BDR25DRAFT_390152 [Lindgomyces ingoldianus]KAF2477610.1 hypothetical protein BDR25DRAFT_390152 [Lindgomyces ingoldianus]